MKIGKYLRSVHIGFFYSYTDIKIVRQIHNWEYITLIKQIKYSFMSTKKPLAR